MSVCVLRMLRYVLRSNSEIKSLSNTVKAFSFLRKGSYIHANQISTREYPAHTSSHSYISSHTNSHLSGLLVVSEYFVFAFFTTSSISPLIKLVQRVYICIYYILVLSFFIRPSWKGQGFINEEKCLRFLAVIARLSGPSCKEPWHDIVFLITLQ